VHSLLAATQELREHYFTGNFFATTGQSLQQQESDVKDRESALVQWRKWKAEGNGQAQ